MLLNIVYILFSLWPVLPTPQSDPILMNVNGRSILRSEFEYKMNADNMNNLKGKSLKTYVDRYVLDQLKISAALSAGLDTTQTFRSMVGAYRKQLVRAYLSDGKTDEEKAKALYDKLHFQVGAGEVRIVQIYMPLKQNALLRDVEATRQKMDSIYSALYAKPELFGAMMRRYSARTDTMWIASLDCPEEIERAAFALSPNKFSPPFESADGIHIIKAVERRSLPPFEEMKPLLLRKLEGNDNSDNEVRQIVDRMKNELGYTPNDEALEELRRTGSTDKTLFTIGGKTYTSTDFQRFATAHPMEKTAQVENFINKSILDCGSRKLASRYPEIQLKMKLYSDNLLVREENRISSFTHIDSLSLRDYFAQNKSDYSWPSPRFRGAVIYGINKKMGKKARKALKKLPYEEWATYIASNYNQKQETVRLQQGLFAEGDNAAIDNLEFGSSRDFEPQMGFPYIATVGKKVKAPDDYREVIDKVTTDYRNHLQSEWMERLKATGKVEISEEVLKTVNNH
jgi:peptidyl-prolyl cis-trans isomerase SurA